MSRRKQAPKRDILSDPLFKSQLLSKFINIVMVSGKKSIAESIIYGALEDVLKRMVKNPALLPQQSEKTEQESESEDGEGAEGSVEAIDVHAMLAQMSADTSIYKDDAARTAMLEVFRRALGSVTPMVEVKSRRVGGSTYQVPVSIHAKRRMALAMRWMATYSSQRSERSMMQRLANEIIDAVAGRGGAWKKKEDVYRMAKANQAFAHYRW
jgi:small subunit ribosomal protein S7